jgi:hypothetical protein
MGVPSNRDHSGVGPIVGALDVAAKSRFRCRIPDSGTVRGVDGGSGYVELGFIRWEAWNKRAVRLVKCLVVHGFMISLTVELGF